MGGTGAHPCRANSYAPKAGGKNVSGRVALSPYCVGLTVCE